MGQMLLGLTRAMIIVLLLHSVAQAQHRLSKNIVTDFGARCNGVADDAPAFMSFNSWARAQTLPITLTVPSGSVCNFASTPNTFVAGVKNLVVSGYGAKFTTTLGSFFLGGFGVVQDNRTSALVASVSAGTQSVILLTSSQSSRFTVGQYVLLTGVDLQGEGYPPNPWVFEYAKVAAISAGLITLSAPLQDSYKSTWPSYQTGSTFSSSLGGPATLYALDPSWNTVLEYRGLTISGNVQTYAIGRSVKFTDVTFNCELNNGVAPTQNLNITLSNVTMPCQMEVDKLVSNFDIEGGTFNQLMFQSSSGATVFTMNNATVTILNGTPQQAVISNSNIGILNLGTLAYGWTTYVSCNTCNIGALKKPPGGVLDSNVDTKYTMSGGVITIPNSNGPARWGVPGANLMFALYNGSLLTEGSPFQVIDVTQDASNTYIHTSLSGGFPSVPRDANTGLSIYAHPAPNFTCTSCTGSADAIDISQAPASTPIFSYSKRTYRGNIQTPPTFTMWGKIVKISINVTTPYTGGLLSLMLNPFGAYGTQIVSGGAASSYNPTINLKIAGERDIFPNSVSGTQPGDSILVPGPIWFANVMGPYLTADISGEPSSAWPTFTIGVTTDQGVISP
jgi:hypothetical protein